MTARPASDGGAAAAFGTKPAGGQSPVAARIAAYLATGRPQRADVQRAADILVLIQEPDAAMAAAGDAKIWRQMIDAALVARWDADGAVDGAIDTEPDADEN
ncbi:hypothetical protein [Sphingopyxis sp. MSC1_008]|uniref:hypothetical protein n=1 Tax=Sphingopyxis sp. MSC1_008 TaxID=2909265 RepID=UPI0020BE13C9|nr:hypothetical protein [Sphingopyxis sp. MSC1_008]